MHASHQHDFHFIISTGVRNGEKANIVEAVVDPSVSCQVQNEEEIHEYEEESQSEVDNDSDDDYDMEEDDESEEGPCEFDDRYCIYQHFDSSHLYNA